MKAGQFTGLLAAAAMLAIWPAAASAQPLHWYRGNTHAHTINSDGNRSPDLVVRWYREHGYHFVFITDHEFATDVAPLNAMFGAAGRFLVLPGQEITQRSEDPARASAHLNSLFTTRVIWPVGTRRCVGGSCGALAPAAMPLAETFRTNIAAVRAQGGIAQVNHPNFLWSVRPEDLAGIPDGTLLEIWNGHPLVNNLGGGDGAGDVRPAAEGYWDRLLSAGRIVWGVATDDSHDFGEPPDPEGALPGQAWIMVRAGELTPAAIRAALGRGNFYASTGVTLTDISVSDAELALTIAERRAGTHRYATRFTGQDGRLLAEVAGTTPRYRFTGSETYVRASVIDSNGRRAWTQPVFRDGRRQ
ncbi:MAG: CehA/McbA family metallohydrolase [Sphingosinicella sp.]